MAATTRDIDLIKQLNVVTLLILKLTASDIIAIIRYAADLAHFALQAAHLDLDADNSLEFGWRDLHSEIDFFLEKDLHSDKFTFTLQRNLRSTTSWVTRGEATFVGDFSLAHNNYVPHCLFSQVGSEAPGVVPGNIVNA